MMIWQIVILVLKWIIQEQINNNLFLLILKWNLETNVMVKLAKFFLETLKKIVNVQMNFMMITQNFLIVSNVAKIVKNAKIYWVVKFVIKVLKKINKGFVKVKFNFINK